MEKKGIHVNSISVTSLSVSHTGFTEHIIIKGNVVIVDSRSFGAMYGGLYWTNNGE